MSRAQKTPPRERSRVDGIFTRTSALQDALRGRLLSRRPRPPPGAPAGLDAAHPSVNVQPEPGQVVLTVFDYGRDSFDETALDAADGLELPPRKDGTVRWIDIVGLHPFVVARLKEQVGLHTLAAEDVLHIGQRPRLEAYDDHLYLPVQMVRLVEGGVAVEQVSMFVFASAVLTFQERVGDVWTPLRARLRKPGSRARQNGADFLAYALLDAVVDNAFPVVEGYGVRLEAHEVSILESPQPSQLAEVQAIRRELGALRRSFGPSKKALEAFSTNEVIPLKKLTRTFMRDVLGHADQLVDLVDAHWDVAGGLTDLYMSVASHRMNQVMKVLTILSALFIPLTFLAGVYGMNLSRLPGSNSPAAFWVFVAVCGVLATAMLAVFWTWGWFERKR